MKKIFYFFVGYLFLVGTSTWSQEPEQKYQFVTIKAIVSKIGVNTIIQDHYGFIWMGTNGGGLNRFDGINYTSYTKSLDDSNSLSNNTIHCSYKDTKNRLWFGSDGGLNLYNREKDQFKRISLSEFKVSKTKVSVRSLMGDHNGNLFVGTFELGLFKINLATFKVEKIVSQEHHNATPLTIHSLQSDSNGKIYAGTDKGLKEFDPKTNSLKFSKFKTEEGIEIINDPIQKLLIANNNLWVGTMSTGLFKINSINNKKNQLVTIKHFLLTKNRFMSIINLSDGTLMCGIENDGLIHINDNGSVINHYTSKKTDAKGLLCNSIWSLFLDHNERIWVGYHNAGVAIYDKLNDKFKDIESLYNDSNSLQIGSVTSIVKDPLGNFWIGLDGGGIDVLNPKLNKFTHINSAESKVFSGLTNDYIEALFVDSNQNIWAGSWGNGLYVLKKGSKKFINYTIKNTNGDLGSNYIFSITEDLDGTIWFSSWDKGLNSYNPDTHKFVHHKSEPFVKSGISDSFSRKVLVDKQGNIWLTTTDKGLFKIKKLIDGSFSIVSMAFRMSEKFNNYATANHILSLYESSDGSIWIGTRGAGLCKYNPNTDKFTWYNKQKGLEAINITGIIEDLKGNIWLSTNSGITKFNSATSRFTTFTKDDGLLSNDFNTNATFRDNNGTIYFGNYLGIDYFDPSNISVNAILPSLYLTDFKLFNQSVLADQKDSPLTSVIGETKNLTLNHTQSVFTIEYTGINYTRPELNQYAYYLEGLEDSWNYVGSLKSATYTNLEPGNYTFKLKVANSDGKWTETPLTLKITVLPPWWKSNMAWFSYFVLLVFGGYHFNRFMLNRLDRKKTLILEQSKRLQEKALNEQKFQFFTNISHEFRTPLTLIMNPIIDIIRDDSLNLPARIREKHNIIYKNTDRLYRLINELLDFRKLELNKTRVSATQFNLVDFTKDVASYFKEEAITNNIDLNIDADVMDIPVWGDEKMLEKIIFNILSNAIKTTPKGGTINIDLQATDKLFILPLVSNTEPIKVVEISISDTGVGIDQEEVEKIFERFYQAKNLNNGYYGGTGIGLEVVREFVNLHKGKIEVESEVGKGSKFKIILPAGKSHFNESEIATEKGEQQFKNENFTPTNAPIENEKTSTENQSSNKYTLLIVEDNAELRDYLQNELGNDYKVLTAENGKKGLEIAKELLPDIIVTDVIMPEMNGFDFCKNIKTDIRTSHIPLLMLTAKTTIDDRMEGIELGADAYMAKPFDMRLLRLRLKQLITSRQLIFNKYFSLITEVPANINTTSLDKEFIEKVLSFINDNIGNPDLNVEILASQLNLSKSQFYRKIKALTNQTANEFLRNIRLQKAKQIIEKGNTNISEVCYEIGFSSPSYFTKCFKSHFGLLPSEVKIKKYEF
ncbi:two-component regulator propeller domain-containing protein [Flavobacterium sp. Arc3]|uniref:hybrid sensor histidine kinase/response regulator transcription factor n=1 Tax=Flavobacterium sp. Arc3 TaxID=3046686 RepID=UPI00352D5AA9